MAKFGKMGLMMSNIAPIRLTPSELAAAADTLGEAFSDDPFVRQLYPVAETRRRCFAKTARCVLRYGMTFGEVWAVSREIEGVAVWFPPDRITPSVFDMFRFGFFGLPFGVGVPAFRRIWAYVMLSERLRQRHAHGPHWYLQLLGVHPAQHGHGYGSLLLRHTLARLDRECVPSCLDTENEKNVALYEHFGFRVCESATIPGTNAGVWFMAREVGAGPTS